MNEIIHKSKLRAGKRTYFFNIKKAQTETLYLEISESRKNEEGEYQSQKIIIFPDEIKHFKNEIVEIYEKYFVESIKLAPVLGVHIEENSVIAEIRNISPKAYTAWTKEEDEKLEKYFCQGKTSKELSEIFQRQVGAITSRISKLELKEKYSK